MILIVKFVSVPKTKLPTKSCIVMTVTQVSIKAAMASRNSMLMPLFFAMSALHLKRIAMKEEILKLTLLHARFVAESGFR